MIKLSIGDKAYRINNNIFYSFTGAMNYQNTHGGTIEFVEWNGNEWVIYIPNS